MLDETRRQSAGSANRSSAPGVIGQNPMYGNYHSAAHYQRQPDTMFQRSQVNAGVHRNDAMQALTENFNRVNLQAPSYHGSMKPSPSMSTQSFDGGVPIHTGFPQAYMPGGQYLYTGPQYTNNTIQQHGMTNGYSVYPSYPQFGYSQNVMSGHSPISSGWAPSSRVPSNEVPSLITPRRDSSSSQEGDAPGTPLTHYTGDYHNNVTVVGRSPGMYTSWSTPSPTQAQYKHQHRASISPRLQLLVQQEPAIPHAIPAPYSPVKPLDRSLENPHGITNVYIRGLLPDTTDEKLKALAGRFGDVISHKSIIDHATNQCKGFGFVKFYNFKDAEDCIRGFHYLGYESSFARESFYSQLKKLHDDDNTNLYVSNLPKEMNEHELGAIFAPHKVCSSRILRDSHGNGRGVGFARFESRDVCEEIIKTFNNTPVAKPEGEEHLIQIRYADTPDQKHLKQQTTAARQYRTAEYESVTQGRTPFLSPARLADGGMTNGGPQLHQARPGFENYHQDFERYMKSEVRNSRGLAAHGMNDRLSTVSSHLGTPQGSVVHVNLPAIQAGSAKLDNSDNQSEECDRGEQAAEVAITVQPTTNFLEVATMQPKTVVDLIQLSSSPSGDSFTVSIVCGEE